MIDLIQRTPRETRATASEEVHKKGMTRQSLPAAERSRLEQEIIDISEMERRRMGREFHDGLGQKLTGVSLMASILAEKLEGKGLPEAADARRLLRMVQDSVRDARSLARGLFPIALREKGLVEALQDLLTQVREASGIQTTLHADDWTPLTDTAASTHVYRIVQEAVNNAVKHSGCNEIRVALAMQGDMFHVCVEDDGAGLSTPNSSHDGMGLHLMHYRAQLMGGNVEIKSGQSGGCHVDFVFHLPRGQASGNAR